MKDFKKFDYGKFRIEFRVEKDGELRLLKKKIDSVDQALKETEILRDCGYSDVKIINNK